MPKYFHGKHRVFLQSINLLYFLNEKLQQENSLLASKVKEERREENEAGTSAVFQPVVRLLRHISIFAAPDYILVFISLVK